MHALKVLEFDRIREAVEAHCETRLGADLAQSMLPTFEERVFWGLLEETRQGYDALAKHSLPPLGGVRDLRDALLRAERGATLGGVELQDVGGSLASMRAMRSALVRLKAEAPSLAELSELLPDHQRLEQQLLDSFEGEGHLRDTASPALGTVRNRKRSAAVRIVERIQSYATGKTRDLLSDPIYTVRDGRYVVPLKSENRGKIRGIVHDASGSGQTLYVEPEDVVQLGNQLREIEAAEREEELRILAMLSSKVGAVAREVSVGIEAAGKLDFILARARLAFDHKACVPERVQGHFIRIELGRHPLLESQKAVPLSLEVGSGRSLLITGPNTGGKTVAIKTVGLFALMAQCGLMLPAASVRFGSFSHVWADIGDEQSMQQSLSTFGGHIKNISEALKGAKPGALVLLDEIGAGTDPAEGAALAKAILNELVARGAIVVASTHYGELKSFAYDTAGFENAAMEFDAKTLRPTFRLILGAPGASHALKIAERYGIPPEVVETARDSLGEQAKEIGTMIERLDQAQRQARIAQGEADRRTAELKRAEARAAQKLAEAEEARQKAYGRANELIEAALREIRLEAQRIFEEVKSAGSDQKALERARKQLRELQEAGSDFAKEFAPKTKPAEVGSLKKGEPVRIEGYTQVGTLLEDPKEGQAWVQMGILKITVPVVQLRSAKRVDPEPVKTRANLQLTKTLHAHTEINLIGRRAEEASRSLETFLDDALLAGLPSVRIVHGKGTGALRQVTHDVLKRHHDVAQYRDGEPAEGGAGVTIAVFR
jgi:DNA mismatch repair protein MutS2